MQSNEKTIPRRSNKAQRFLGVNSIDESTAYLTLDKFSLCDRELGKNKITVTINDEKADDVKSNEDQLIDHSRIECADLDETSHHFKDEIQDEETQTDYEEKYKPYSMMQIVCIVSALLLFIFVIFIILCLPRFLIG